MATIDMTSGTAGHGAPTPNTASPYLAERYVVIADAITEKGSALATGDVIQVIDLPKGTVVLAAGTQADAVMTGTATDLTVDFGITGGDVDRWTDAWDYDGATAGDYGTQGVAGYEPFLVTTADTADLLLTFTGTVLTGTIRCWAVLMDVSGKPTPGTAAAGS